MKRALSVLALCLVIGLMHASPAAAFFTRGTINRDLSYDRLALTPPPSGAETYRPKASGVIENTTRQKISLTAEISFCNVFGEPLGSAKIRCTIPPMKKKAFKATLKDKVPVDIKDAHHVEWTLLRVKKG
ncbi:hypothetical protein [Desulfoluna butyratoxydans]|uniref:Uncharacterized protein n=1 Tax=Desulfoluna butyratoxydans TaxID=231438 RepID=A0A4U8YKR9_9BACT|nr:hypothetical protein [Desulfoluna butyratoxydans]VFQ44495.1 hypothetical protein MSL71_21440 [Desulfoluna butyratoxydans]